MRQRVRESLIAMTACMLYPVTVSAGIYVVGRRALHREAILTRSDGRWLGRHAVRAIQGFLTLWILLVVMLMIASIFTPVPNI